MTDSVNALSRRIKKHIIGRTQTFFAVTSPGFENICLDELMRLDLSEQYRMKSPVVVHGGVEFQGRLHDCYKANLSLRTCTRILMRLTEFKAVRFDQIEKKLGAFPWELYLGKGMPVKIFVTTRKSKLYHGDAVAARISSLVSDRLDKADALPPISEPVSEPNSETASDDPVCDVQQLFVRVIDDRISISIDSSGIILYRRGIKTHGGTAPIRETTAAAVLKLAGYEPAGILADPMFGSGTFSIEAAMMAMNMPAGYFRRFAFMDWPSFRPGRWAYIKREAEKNILPMTGTRIFASDKDHHAVHMLAKTLAEKQLDCAVSLQRGDFFEISPSLNKNHEPTDRQKVVVLNPPYGKRLGNPVENKRLLADIFKKLASDYKGWQVALITPQHQVKPMPLIQSVTRAIPHGGLKLTLQTGKIK